MSTQDQDQIVVGITDIQAQCVQDLEVLNNRVLHDKLSYFLSEETDDVGSLYETYKAAKFPIEAFLVDLDLLQYKAEPEQVKAMVQLTRFLLDVCDTNTRR